MKCMLTPFAVSSDGAVLLDAGVRRDDPGKDHPDRGGGWANYQITR